MVKEQWIVMQYLKLPVVVIALLLLAAACSGKGNSAGEHENFNPETFKDSTNIDNKWFPLKPGMQYSYEGYTNDDEGNRISRRLVVTVTDLAKVIDGVRTVVTWDLDYNADQLVEAELAFYAQDKNGTVWRMGEHPEEYKSGKFVEAPTWISGIADSIAGIEMQGDPQPGQPSYSQGWAPDVDFTDRGQVSQTDQKVCVPASCYEAVLIIDETSQAEPGAHQLKYYAPGVGNIKVDWKGADQTQEMLELTNVIQLSSDQLANAGAEALKEEEHAYEVSKDVYGKTAPLERPDGTSVNTRPTAEPTASTVTSAKATQIIGSAASEIIVYAADLSESALSELDFINDPASPGGKWIGLPNTGDELDPPPENDPHLTFKVQVQSGIPYRCWIHMKVGIPKGKSQANVIWAQFSDAVDQSNQAMLEPGTGSYLTAQGPAQPGWAWVGCDLKGSDSLIYFQPTGEITVRLQAGMEGAGFDQFILSSAEYLESPPSEAIVEK
jgi:hypothetical protein